MKILLISQYKENIINNSLPIDENLYLHYKTYHFAVYQALIAKGYDVILSNGLENDLENKIINCDVVFSIRHDLGYTNSDLFVKLLAQKHSKRCVGNSSYSKFYDTDKIVGKLLAENLKIKTPDYCLPYQIDELHFSPLYFLKPRFSASSLNIKNENIFESVSTLKYALSNIEKPGQYFIEKFIDGITATVGCMYKDGKVIVSTPYTLKSKNNKVITYEDKKTSGVLRGDNPSLKNINLLKSYAVKYFLHIQPCQIARLDFMISKSNELFFLEINTTPNLGCKNGFISSLVGEYFGSYENFIDYLVISAIAFNK